MPSEELPHVDPVRTAVESGRANMPKSLDVVRERAAPSASTPRVNAAAVLTRAIEEAESDAVNVNEGVALSVLLDVADAYRIRDLLLARFETTDGEGRGHE